MAFGQRNFGNQIV